LRAGVRVETINDNEHKTVMGIDIAGVPMYNLVQGSGPGKPFHHKGIGSGTSSRLATRESISQATQSAHRK
jgi:hypothetical protein